MPFPGSGEGSRLIGTVEAGAAFAARGDGLAADFRAGTGCAWEAEFGRAGNEDEAEIAMAATKDAATANT